MMTLQTTPERVRQAAESCPDAKRVLQTLFPDAFQAKGLRVVVGDHVRNSEGNTYIVCEAPSGARYKGMLINIANGNRWGDGEDLQPVGDRAFDLIDTVAPPWEIVRRANED